MFGFSQTLYQDANSVKCLMLCPYGQHLLETDSLALLLPTFIKMEGMEKPDRPGSIWYLTLMAASILNVEPMELEVQHQNTMENLYGKDFLKGVVTKEELSKFPSTLTRIMSFLK